MNEWKSSRIPYKINIYNKSDNIRISKRLDHSEFKCQCNYDDCTRTLISEWLISAFELMRHEIAVPLTVTSGFRCQRHNKNVGGVDNSNHKYGMAIDILKIDGLLDLANKYFEEVIEYKDFIHCGVRR